ncbi:gliding motility associated protein GldN [Mucilaginibacter gracilis]|uniref:Gliding motility associated protein GldN n=1 Tax=Mucilaginibacter gracilis TaxID=423350 RepID=A0A495IW68_9SPHI|nr:gliding motility protein GldN [Mucilaginibacter gracilis]RKR80832.1 gliding motility associated protein GldN [Mucilaginibacter gracilis]
MKKGILVLLFLSLVGGTFAQKKGTKAKNKKAVSKTKTAVPTNVSLPVPVSNTQVSAVTQTALVDTTKKVIAAIPVDRPIDGVYKKTDIVSAQPVAYATIREADVVYQKRVWREIDLREKMNQYMAAPQARLIDVLMDAIKNDELRAFDASPTKECPGGDNFAIPLTSKETLLKLSDSVLVSKIDPNTGEVTGTERRMSEFNPDSVVKFRIKEDWIFDKQRGEFKPHIIGIAPLIQLKVAGSKLEDYQPAFWIYFPEARPILAAKEAFTKYNDASNLNYDQIFAKRIFSSYIVKVSNDKDERIKDYKQGIDRLYEAERIKKSLMDYELNLWQY